MADPIWLPEVLKAKGLECDIYPGAFGNGHGDFGSIWGVIAHHTGSFGETPRGIAQHPTLGLASQLYLGRNGKYVLCGVGIAYHAGTGSWKGLPANNANARTIGIEAANDGSSGWSSAQYNSYVKGVAAILTRLRVGSDRVIGHKEWGAIQGKWDPGLIDMNVFRRQVGAEMANVKPIVVPNEINEAAKRSPWVGARQMKDELAIGRDGRGRMVAFENAHIYWYPGLGAFPIPHADPELGAAQSGLFEAYREYNYERGELGYPVRAYSPIETKTGAGAVQAFQGGILYRQDGHQGYVVKGLIGQRWAREGYEQGDFGWPTSNEYPVGTGVRQDFEFGSLEWDPSGVVAREYDDVDSNGLPAVLDKVAIAA
ncbi:lysin A, N-acetylmuramoyl-L-alanine amidase domain [Gordonia phage VanLee]|uniref:N-acetylmuramoyl-L-alanine amidase n=1 Tax=Gordonia phage VanLee TaxID=2845816 RepID=A0A8F2IF64_9CAUD|nr:lysin A, N-acetylmuramoyl-L-alanine amidase domain [Gordonia phage VanLee]QWS68146.1 lysin A, N-acetylmuramoyl-L-alanine amidase domain [Gordonia phage VanLee]